MFITFEGGEGSGKTTQINSLMAFLKSEYKKEVIVTREPGGTVDAEKIRSLLVERDGGAWDAQSEAFLLFAARRMHTEHLIKPALAEGKIVISDRYTDSTRAYQGAGMGMNAQDIESIKRIAIGDFEPDLTLILDLPVKEGLARSGRRLSGEGSTEDRYERLDIDFHERMRKGFLEIARSNPARCHVIDALQPIEDVERNIREFVEARL